MVEGAEEGAPTSDGDLSSEYESVKTKPNLSYCCVCSCNCSNDRLFRMTCCGCIPIKAGVFIIGLLTIFLTIWEITFMFLLILDDYLDWYYPAVAILLLVMYYIASSIYVLWFIKDSVESRARLPTAIILILVATSLLLVWHLVYFTVLYKRDFVYIGYGGDEFEVKKF